jgi:hypothetical protein
MGQIFVPRTSGAGRRPGSGDPIGAAWWYLRMLGLVHACRSTLDDEQFAQWQAHLCGLCLSLRDSRGQLSRAVTNTDAVLVSVLVEAQLPAGAARTTAGPCPLRGMRTAAVVPAGAAAARLGATASLTLAAAKAADVVGERTHGMAPGAFRARAAGAMRQPLRRAALADRSMAEAVGVVELLTDLSGQAELEARVRSGDPLAMVTAPTARACARVFATAAVVADRPVNEAPLRAIGAAFGELAHLLDAVDDLDEDRRRGAFNPVLVTGTPLPEVRRHCRALVRTIRERFDELELTDGRLARAVLVDGTRSAVHRAFGAGSTCATTRSAQPDPSPPRPDSPPHEAPDAPAPDAPMPDAPPKPPQPRPFLQALLPWIGVYCTGYACCADHENPCTGRQHSAGCGSCTGCDGCGSCCECGDCCCDCGCCD